MISLSCQSTILSPFFGDEACKYSIKALSGGLINESFCLKNEQDEAEFVLQRLNPIFAPQVNDDIAALVTPLRANHLAVPMLLPTRNGQHYVHLTDEQCAGCWRILEYMPGRCIHRVEDLAQVRSLAKTLAQFHSALVGSKYCFVHTRPAVHDFARHSQNLRIALDRHPDHPLFAELSSFYEDWRALCVRQDFFQEPDDLPLRIIHGDPKISNFLFDENNEVCAVLDLDTMAWSALDCEWGDALRSWANDADENHAAVLVPERIDCAIKSYTEHAPWLSDEELSSFKRAPMRIATELAARFGADALNECYFRYDPDIAPSHGEHALLRARNQYQLALQFEGL